MSQDQYAVWEKGGPWCGLRRYFEKFFARFEAICSLRARNQLRNQFCRLLNTPKTINQRHEMQVKQEDQERKQGTARGKECTCTKTPPSSFGRVVGFPPDCAAARSCLCLGEKSNASRLTKSSFAPARFLSLSSCIISSRTRAAKDAGAVLPDTVMLGPVSPEFILTYATDNGIRIKLLDICHQPDEGAPSLQTFSRSTVRRN